MFKKSLNVIIFLLIILGISAMSYHFIFAAIVGPTIVFSGDDILQNGGTDDYYDALLTMDITSLQATPTVWDMQYSNDAGQTWNNIVANFETISNNQRKYYWSTSNIYAPTLLTRVRTQQAGSWTDYTQNTLSLSHRVTAPSSHYFVESFNDSTYKGASNNITWDANRALVELAPSGGGNYKPNGSIVSLDLLSGVANNNIFSVTFQPVQNLFDGTQYIHYQLSNDGVNWYGSAGLGSYFSFLEAVPEVVTVAFNQSVGDKLYWRADLHAANPHDTPQVFQLRFTWQENTTPMACFIVNPTTSADKEQVFAFNANCSSDYEDNINQLSFRWDFNNDGAWDTAYQAGSAGYLKTNNYHSTSTFVAKVQVLDTGGASSTFTNSINEIGVEGDITSWLWSSNYGWTSLNCNNSYYGTPIKYCPPNYGWTLNANYTITGWAWDENLGWLCVGSTCAPYGNTPGIGGGIPSAVYSRDSGAVVGWGKYIMFGESGWLKLRDAAWCQCGGANQPACGTEGDQCVYINMSRRSLEGFGWAGGVSDAGASIGPGWVQFSGAVNVPWLETKFGSIYGRKDLGSIQTSSGATTTAQGFEQRYSASYCILAHGNVVNLTSEIGCTEAGYKDLDYPSANNNYHTILGAIDFGRLIDGNQLNRQFADVDANLPKTLAGKVYNFSGVGLDSFTLDTPITFFNAKNLNSSGAGTIIIDGDLHINNNMYYETNALSGKIENLASVAWIVKGDLYIDPAVKNIVGNFIVLGEPGSACPAPSCGRIFTGNDSASPTQLVWQGIAMAKQFLLQRYYKTNGEPAEKIIYDGRVLANTPPGLEDFSAGLPVWSEALPTNSVE